MSVEKMKAEALLDHVRKKSEETGLKTFFVVMHEKEMRWFFTGMGPGETQDRLRDAHVALAKINQPPQ